jgi:hypothetical protein
VGSVRARQPRPCGRRNPDATFTRFEGYRFGGNSRRGQSLLELRLRHGEVTMNTGLHRIELDRLAASGGQLVVLPGAVRARSNYLGAGVAGLLAVLTAGAAFTLAKWSPPPAASAAQKVRVVTAFAEAPGPAATLPASATPDDMSLYAATVLPDASAPPDTAVAGGLSISSQRWQRGGLGSNALVTFTLRNSNDYAVKDIEISCAFSRRDGSHLTDRTRVVHDTVKMNGRKSFARWHIGFVNVNADRAKCMPVAATRI